MPELPQKHFLWPVIITDLTAQSSGTTRRMFLGRQSHLVVHGNPSLRYFKQCGADMDWAFGNSYIPFRDANDLYSVPLVSGCFAGFIKSGQPNPPLWFSQSQRL